jgi:hypothetical protein
MTRDLSQSEKIIVQIKSARRYIINGLDNKMQGPYPAGSEGSLKRFVILRFLGSAIPDRLSWYKEPVYDSQRIFF